MLIFSCTISSMHVYSTPKLAFSIADKPYFMLTTRVLDYVYTSMHVCYTKKMLLLLPPSI